MKQVIYWEAIDGRIFNSTKLCLEYEEVLQKVEKIMEGLNPLPKDENCIFVNGGGYIQQNKDIVDTAKNNLVDLGNTFFKQKEKWSFIKIGRLFDDLGYTCFYSAWDRLSNIDIYYREWGQGYYAINPEKGIQKPFIETI